MGIKEIDRHDTIVIVVTIVLPSFVLRVLCLLDGGETSSKDLMGRTDTTPWWCDAMRYCSLLCIVKVIQKTTRNKCRLLFGILSTMSDRSVLLGAPFGKAAEERTAQHNKEINKT
jgi:hypothetical protein